MEVVASLSQGRTAAAQCGLFTHESVPVIFEPPYNSHTMGLNIRLYGDGCLYKKMFTEVATKLLCCLVYSQQTKIIFGGPK